MPYIKIIDSYGHARQISSSDNETVARWLVETLSLFTHPNETYGNIRIDVRALWVGPETGGAWDWHPAANESLWAVLNERTPVGNVRALAKLMTEYADKIEEKGRD